MTGPPKHVRAFLHALPRCCYGISRTKGRIPKTRHRTRAAAADAATKIDDPNLHQYQCPVCGYWHNGHPRNQRATLSP